ncbi:TerD family protein [Jatrophihabitans fulvus]
MITDPKFAPARPDITFLKRRVRPKQQASPSTPNGATAAARTPSAPAASGPRIDYTRRDRTPAQPPAAASPPPSPPQARPPSPPQAPPRADPPAPAAGGGSLDLSSPAPSGSGSAAPGGRIEYSRPGSGPAAGSSSLDLSGGPAPAPSGAPRARTPQAPAPLPAWLERHVTRVSDRRQHIMSVQAPTVTLTRVQSGIGELQVEAVCSDEVGDLRLGAAYQLRSGGSGIVQYTDGNRFGPSSRRPVIIGSREEYEHLGIDLRQVADIERIAVYAFSQSRATLTWGGTLVVTLFGGARLELPLERLYPGPLAMLMTFYNMDGELVVRAEMENIAGDIREAARAYGFDRITWRDGRTPVE